MSSPFVMRRKRGIETEIGLECEALGRCAPPMTSLHDKETLAFYDRQAFAYAHHKWQGGARGLDVFLSRLVPGARILELGCGGGRDTESMLRAGFDATATDGSAGLAGQAELRLGRPVRILLFEELDAQEAYDAVWANACLLHVPKEALPDVLGRIWRALKRGGLFFASYKVGEGVGRDALGRYNNFVSCPNLQASYNETGPWSELSFTEAQGSGYDGVARKWLFCVAKSRDCSRRLVENDHSLLDQRP